MRFKVKVFITVIVVLMVVTAISLVIISRGPLYGQAENDNWVPNMIGTWTGEGAGYVFFDVTQPASEPVYFEGPGDRDLVITHQIGRTFAGSFSSGDGGNRFKLTGVIMPDRTVSIQYFESSEERHFYTGRLTKSEGMLQISGYMQFFDDFREDSDKMMASTYGRLVKVN